MGTQSTWGQHSYCVSTKTHYTYTQNMLRFVIGALLLSTTVLGAVQPRVQPNARQFEPQQTEFGEWKIEPQQTEFGEWKVVSQGDNVQGREEFGANVDLTTPLGGAGINANVGLPAPANNLLTTAVIGLGVSSLVNTVATVVIPFFKTDEAPATVKCVVSEWSECKAANLLDCGPGTQTRTVKIPASNGGEECSSQRTQSCEMSKKCPVKCVVSEWSECMIAVNSRHCGPGTKTRTVTTPASHGGQECPELIKECSSGLDPCPVKCVLSEWSECKTEDSRDCGPGTQTKTVLTPASNGGEECSSQRTQSCEMSKKCPVNCKMSDWGDCSKSCGEGIKTREIEIEAANGGTDCLDKENVTESCNLAACPDAGNDIKVTEVGDETNEVVEERGFGASSLSWYPRK